jgi:hypothetical protein
MWTRFSFLFNFQKQILRLSEFFLTPAYVLREKALILFLARSVSELEEWCKTVAKAL